MNNSYTPDFVYKCSVWGEILICCCGGCDDDDDDDVIHLN